MAFDPGAYDPAAASLLETAGGGVRPMPLVSPRTGDSAAAAVLRRPTTELFPRASRAIAAHAGLWLYFGFFDEAHSLAQDLQTIDGSYWHAICHRMEPDAWNSGYWFRRVGTHPVFRAVRDAAEQAGYPAGSQWDPFSFVEACTEARAGSPGAELLERVQLAEWQILFDHCARVES